ncbi:MAG: YifB family Mg chelatase-like AAA ATPase [Eubacteriales bacterium]|nr:YifB family Mg chelatase-like AAA ATPase [Eubacteriales bacterium]
MLSKVQSYGLMGLLGYPLLVETDISGGIPAYETVGLPDATVKESKERVRAAIKNSGFKFPTSRITVNLAPADIKKEGAVYDLPIAVSILMASGQLGSRLPDEIVMFGELALDGQVRPVNGVLPMIIDAFSKGYKCFAVPAQNAAEAAYIEGATILPLETLRQFAEYIRGNVHIQPMETLYFEQCDLRYSTDFSEIKGQQSAKRAAEVAIAGGHNILLCGTPGSGKTMLARAIPSILPELTFEEALEITKIHSLTGATRAQSNGMIMERPFRSPHHGASSVSLVGGGSKALPGEISLAHMGVLFLDEFPEFQRDVLEALRQPLEDGYITISRSAATATYPASFMLVAAMNPCPCGNHGSRMKQCTCTSSQIHRYAHKLSGPLLDRIDIHIEMTEVGYAEITDRGKAESSADVRARVNAARQIQRERFSGSGIFCNAKMNSDQIRRYCTPTGESEKLIKQAYLQLKLSARAYQRVLKVARTIADLEGESEILPQHYAEALQYRSVSLLMGD